MSFTLITGSNITDAAGNKLAAGSITFIATDGFDKPIPFGIGGGGQAIMRPVSFTVTNGAIAAGAQVPDPANTSPAGIYYRIQVTDTSTGKAVLTYTLVQPTGTSWNFDNYQPSARAVAPPPSPQSVTGPLNVAGDGSFTGTLSAGAIGSATNPILDTVFKGPWADIRAFGAVGDGVTDCTSAFQAALTSGKTIFVAPGTYLLVATSGNPAVTVSGKQVRIFGGGPASIVKCDGLAFELDGCNDSYISDIAFAPVTQPTVVTPAQLPTSDPNQVIVIDRFGTGHGYMPTVNDADLWNKCSAAQQNQAFDTGIKVTNSDRVRVSGISGDFYSLLFYDCSYSKATGNSVNGGKNFAGGIVFWQSGSTSAGCHHNSIQDNRVRFASYSGIVIGGGDHAVVTANECSYCGESGIKTGQGSNQQVAYASITGNIVSHNWYDGLDLSSNYPHTGAFAANSTASGNVSVWNNATGLTVDGHKWTISGNFLGYNGTMGAALDILDSTFSSNVLIDNNQTKGSWNQVALGVQVTVSGSLLVANQITIDDASIPGYAIAAGAHNAAVANSATGAAFLFNSIDLSVGNTDKTGVLPLTAMALPSLGVGPGAPASGDYSLLLYASGAVAQALKIASFDATTNEIDISLHPRVNALANDVAQLAAILTVGTSGAESGDFVVRTRSDGTLSEKLRVTSGGSLVVPTGTLPIQVGLGTVTLGGSAMSAGQRITTTLTITNATTGMVAVASPQSDPGAGFVWHAWVSAANTVTIAMTCIAAGTPAATTYNVRVIE